MIEHKMNPQAKVAMRTALAPLALMGALLSAAPSHTQPNENQYRCLAPVTPQRIQKHCTVKENIRHAQSREEKMRHGLSQPCSFFAGEDSNALGVAATLSVVFGEANPKTEAMLKQLGRPYQPLPGLGDAAWIVSKGDYPVSEAEAKGFRLTVVKGNMSYALEITFGPGRFLPGGAQKRGEENFCTLDQAKNLLADIMTACAKGETGYCSKFAK